MKNALRIFLFVAVAFNFTLAQRARINIESVTPHKLTSLGLTESTNSVSTGLNVVGNQTFVYLSPQNIGNTDAITNAAFEITTKPGGSASALTTFNENWVYFQPDVKGAYNVKLTITTASGTDDTTITVYSADFVGVGGFQGVAGSFPKCASCHAGTFSDIFTRWSNSGHAGVFERELENSDHYGTNCMKCHTTGYDHNNAASNGGFDDVAAQLGWSFKGSTSTSFDSIVTDYPGLVNLATIGCESCHGAGSEHAMGGDKKKIAISAADGACAQCHDEPWRHNKVAEYENSMHSEAVFSSSFLGSFANNSIASNCARCHVGQGYIEFTKGNVFSGTGMVQADALPITCATCHDPHGNDNVASLRMSPASSDTLGNGETYTLGGTGKTCLNCHKARRDAESYSATKVTSAHWGPHHSVQGDVFLGMNAADFGTPFISGSHKFALENACVDCHMAESPANGDPNRDHVGGHTFRVVNEETGEAYTESCVGCHGPMESFEEFEASADYDRDGVIEGVQDEIKGLIATLKMYIPPVGSEEVDYAAIGAMNDPIVNKAYYNLQLIEYDGSFGMHNTKFAVDVLSKSITAISGVTPVELVSFDAEVVKGVVTFKWETASETNNKGFDIEKKVGNSWTSIAFVDGKGTTASLSEYSYSYKLEGKASFRLKQVDFDGTFEYSKVIEVTGTVTPKEYTLSQNYPNPFNPSTSIKISLPFDSNVKVVVYSITGEVVKVLVNTVQPAGNHDVQFSTNDLGSSISSGIYFYSLEANAVDGSASFKQTRKMVLMK